MSPRSRPVANVFRIKVFGGVTLEGPQGPVTGRASQRRRLGLLALLAGAGESGLTRERIVTFLWPEADLEKGRRLLSDSIYRVNQALGGDALATAGDVVRLDPSRVTSDLRDFGAAMAEEDWELAVSLSEGVFLDGFYLSGAVDFERWVDGERQRVARERTRALETLAERATEPGEAARWWRLAASSNPYSSRIALRLLQALSQQGERAAAFQYVEHHSRLMREDLGLAPDPEIVRFGAELRDGSPTGVRSSERPDGTGTIESQPPARDPEPSPPLEAAITPSPPRSFGVRRSLVASGVMVVAIGTLGWLGMADRESSSPSSIIVLPFADLGSTGHQEYLADGITEELIDRLGDVKGLRVMGRTTAFAFKDSAVAASDLAQLLGVEAVLEGSVRRSADRLRISTRLVDADSGFEVWSETFEREPADVLATQDEIARAVVSKLQGTSEGLGEGRAATADPIAFNLYLQGRYEWHRRSEEGLRRATELFVQAIQRAPGYGPAYVGLADAYAVSGFYDYLSPQEAFPRAHDAARRAIELDPSLAAPHATLGYVALYYEWDPELAETHFRRALELDPAYSTGHQWFANLLTAAGRSDEAVEAMTRAQELDPLSLIASSALGFVYLYSGAPERAVNQLQRTLGMDSTFVTAHLWQGMALEELGRTDESLSALRRAVALSGGSAIAVAALARGQALAGEPEEAARLVSELEGLEDTAYVPAFEIAKVYDALGEPELALRWLRTAHAHRSHSMVFLSTDPQLETLRSHPETQRLIEEVGFAR